MQSIKIRITIPCILLLLACGFYMLIADRVIASIRSKSGNTFILRRERSNRASGSLRFYTMRFNTVFIHIEPSGSTHREVMDNRPFSRMMQSCKMELDEKDKTLIMTFDEDSVRYQWEDRDFAIIPKRVMNFRKK